MIDWLELKNAAQQTVPGDVTIVVRSGLSNRPQWNGQIVRKFVKTRPATADEELEMNQNGTEDGKGFYRMEIKHEL